MNVLETSLPAGGAGSPGTLSEFLVELFLSRSAHQHGDVRKATDELGDLFASFGIPTEENEAMIRGRALRVARRERNAASRLIDAVSGPAV